MKKLLVSFLVAAMTLAAGSQAFAALFDQGDLFRVVLDRKSGAIEWATDLGSITDLATKTGYTVGGGADAFTLSNTGASSFSNLEVAYFGLYYGNGNTTRDTWASGSTSLTPVSNPRSGSTTYSNYDSVQTLYKETVVSGTNSASASKSSGSSYYSKMDQGGLNPGCFGGLINPTAYPGGEASLAALATGGSVLQYLYNFHGGLSVATTGTYTLTLRTNADGSTTINPSAVPIPPAFFLLGSGLLGLVGLKRRSFTS